MTIKLVLQVALSMPWQAILTDWSVCLPCCAPRPSDHSSRSEAVTTSPALPKALEQLPDCKRCTVRLRLHQQHRQAQTAGAARPLGATYVPHRPACTRDGLVFHSACLARCQGLHASEDLCRPISDSSLPRQQQQQTQAGAEQVSAPGEAGGGGPQGAGDSHAHNRSRMLDQGVGEATPQNEEQQQQQQLHEGTPTMDPFGGDGGAMEGAAPPSGVAVDNQPAPEAEPDADAGGYHAEFHVTAEQMGAFREEGYVLLGRGTATPADGDDGEQEQEQGQQQHDGARRRSMQAG